MSRIALTLCVSSAKSFKSATPYKEMPAENTLLSVKQARVVYPPVAKGSASPARCRTRRRTCRPAAYCHSLSIDLAHLGEGGDSALGIVDVDDAPVTLCAGITVSAR
jgi:hypothetical protein